MFWVLIVVCSFRDSCCIYRHLRFSCTGDRRCGKLVVIRDSHSRDPVFCFMFSLTSSSGVSLSPAPGSAFAVGFGWVAFLWQRTRVTRQCPFLFHCRCWPWPGLSLICCCCFCWQKQGVGWQIYWAVALLGISPSREKCLVWEQNLVWSSRQNWIEHVGVFFTSF